MPKKLKNIILAITCLVSSWSFSQAYPLQVSAQMIPPYSLKLSDYTTAMNERIVATLLLTDVREQNMQIGIRLYIENGRNIAIQSSPAIMGATPLYISGGIPLRLSNLDLRPYFQLENLHGMSPQQYNQPLPDGLYQFCFEVYEWTSGEALSRKSCATAYLVLNDPPILNFPNKGELIAHKDPQNIIFQWTPRHLNATNVQYEFTLTELWDIHMDPQAAFLASRPLYQTTTRANTLLYGPGETALLPDKTYAWRVKALVSDGISETSVFKNGGYSEIFHFTHTGDCDEPAFILAKADSPTSEKIMWQGLGHLKYKIQFRKKVSPSDSPKGGEAREGRWHEINSINEYVTLHNLEGGSTYEFRVGGQCNENAGYTYSQIYEFTTAIPNQALSYNCGITPEIEITNRELLQSLVVNDVFTAGDFPVTIKRITGTPPLGESEGEGFSGWGYIVVPYLQDTKVRVSFNNIKINTDYQFIEGIIETEYDPTWGGMDDIGDEIVAVGETIEVINDLGATTVDILEDVFGETPDNKFDDDTDVVVSEGSNTTETGTDSSNSENESSGNNSEADNTGETNSGVDNSPPNEISSGGDVTANDTSTNEDTNSGEVVIVYNGNEFRNGDAIEIDYRNNLENQRFDIKNVDEGSIVSWSLHSDMDQVQAIASAGEGVYTMYDIRNYQNKALEAQYSLNDKSDKIRVQIKLIKEEFELEELYAVDNSNSKRLAKSGEILYLVKAKGITSPNDRSRKVNYSLTTNPKLEEDEIDKQFITWDYTNINGSRQYDKGKVTIYRNIWERDAAHTTTVETGNPTKKSKSIDVVFVNGDVKTFEFMPPAVNALVKDKLQEIEENLKILDRINSILGLNKKTQFTIEPLRISSQKYNEEDNKSRLYKSYEQASVTAGVKAELAEVSFTHPVLKLAEKTGVFKAGAYFLFKVQAQVTGGVKRHKFVEQNEYIGSDPFIKIISKGCIEAGLRAELLVLENQVDFDIKGYAEGCIVGEFNYSFENEKLTGDMYIPPVILVAHAKIKSKGILKFELVDWREKIEISDRINLTNYNGN